MPRCPKGTFRQLLFFSPLDKVEGVEYTALLAILSQCSVKDATLAVIKFQALYLMVKEKSWRNVHFGYLGEMSVGEICGYR